MINYQCNNCNKKRAVIFPSGLKIKLDPRGLAEYVDVHICKNDKLVANILFIDSKFAVRSQVPVYSKEEHTINKEHTTVPSSGNGFSIPLPKKSSLKEIEIHPSDEFIASNLRELIIDDKLRQLKYRLSRVKSKRNFSVEEISELGFIYVNANLTDKASKKEAKRCMKCLADSLEKIVHLEEDVLKYVVTFLDSKLKEKFDEQASCEIELTLQAPLSIPYFNDRALKLFCEKGHSWFSNLDLKNSQNYIKIIKKCIENQNKTLLEIYEELEEEISLTNFISALYNLQKKSIVEINILKFQTLA
ncbi:MAG: hypothetical protein ACTSSG_05005 [Candidatus Heimdallarchaeaceae archaeon]